MAADPKVVPLQNLLAKKEQEWKELQELRAQSLEEAFKIKDKQLQDERLKFQELKEDFKYNLMLLQERDQELTKTEVLLHKVKNAVNEKVAEISSLKIQLDEMKMSVARETKARVDLQAHYQQRLKSREQDLLRIKIANESEVKKERDNIDDYKRSLQRQLQELEEELGIQKQELAFEMDEVLKKREKECRKKVDEMSSSLLAYEVKVKLLSRELELVRQENKKSSNHLQDADAHRMEREKQLKQKEWELEDMKGMKDARISELESELQLKEATVKKALEDYQRRHAELDRYAREKEAAVSAMKSSQHEMEQKLKHQLRELQTQVEALQVEKRRMEWSNADTVQEKDNLINRLQNEVSDAKSHSDLHLAKISKDVVAKDLEIQALKEVQDALRGELAQRREDVERYKKELSLALERETANERSKTQLDLDWQRRCEAAERNQYASSEDLVERLSRARQEGEAVIKEQQRELDQKSDLIRALTRQRDQAFATLDKHGLTVQHNLVPENGLNPDEGSSVEDLKQQNEMLKNAISSMRQEMEQLGKQSLQKQPLEGSLSNDGPISEEYVKMIEKECRDLKVKNRALNDKINLAGRSKEKGNDGIIPPSVDNAYIRHHIQSLNDTIGTLRTEKLGLTAQLKKQQIRITSLESRLSQVSQQPTTKQAEVDQLQYDISTQMRRHATEVASFRQRIADLELELAETRREADEYYKGGLQTNLEAMALGNQVSALKMDIAAKPHVIPHQSSFVGELQREVEHLRRQLTTRLSHKGPTGDNLLREKLRSAAKHIQQLAKERQQLIEMGNKLRAELNKYRPSKDTSEKRYGQPKLSTKQMKDTFQRKLDDVELLQYQLTMKELQYANRGLHHDETHAEVVQVELSSSSASTSIQENEEDREQSSFLVPDRLERDQSQHGPRFAEASDQLQQGTRPMVAGDATMSNRDGQTPLPMSTFGEESLKDVWQLLDDGMTFMQSPMPTKRDYENDTRQDFNQFTHEAPAHLDIQGEGKQLQQKPVAEKRLISNKVTGKVQQKQSKTTKIRNYNIKDDRDVNKAM
ncbi:coiled-coil domain-containing protein 57-like [Anneissia japonica]|uniref:coiled-coil domain-containing protein 57-like n=1 Tax=Anneissia japonica TaxID=1529436 RepID=UPI001425A6E2|nr:coiled-coil domain-containing protein 57-like [Anneissia japonica]XP_033102590.1 coiled-coil domain-containing protein 57-like [Anneissia japonica]